MDAREAVGVAFDDAEGCAAGGFDEADADRCFGAMRWLRWRA